MRVQVSRYVFAPPGVVWDVLVDWERQPQWMVDARDVRVRGGRRRGTGVRIECPTSLLGVTVRDVMEVTAWEPREVLEVRHVGRLISGTGRFELEPTAVGTRVTWREHVDPPLGRLGEAVAGRLVRPLVARRFRASMDNFKRLCEREARRVRAAGGSDSPGEDVR